MKNKILFIIVFVICNLQITYGQDMKLNDFENNTSDIVARNGVQFSVVNNSSLNQNVMFNNFEPGSPEVVSRFGSSFTIVPNPNVSDENNTANCIKVGRSSGNWWELIAFPVTTYTIPANTTRYLSISVNYPSQPDIVIRIDGEDENSNGDTTVAIRPINKYTDYGNWGTLIFPLNGGQNGIEIKALIIFPDAGFQNEPSGFILNNTDTFGHLDEIKISETDNADTTYEDYLTIIKDELVIEWPTNRTINLVFHGHSVPSGYFQTPTVNTLKSYPHQVLEKLSAKYPTAVINTIKTAIGGENSIRGATRFDEEVLVHRPDVLFIDYSLNDRAPGLDAAYEAWDEMIKKAKARGIKVILLTPSPFQDADLLSTDSDLYKHQQQVIRLATENNVALVDSYERFKEKVEDGDNVNTYLSSFNHPNEIGHNLISDEIMKFF